MSFQFSAFWLSVSTAACTAQPPISGKILMPADGNFHPTVYLVQPRNFGEIAASFAGAVVDSAAVQPDGSFVFEKLPAAPQPILLEIVTQKRGERFANRLDDDSPDRANYFPIVWRDGEKLEIAAAADRLQATFSVKNPSPENAALLLLRDLRHEFFKKFLSENSADAHSETALLDHEAAVRNFQKPLMDFADTCQHLLPALVAARWVSPSGDFERTAEFLFLQCEKWKRQQPENQWLGQLCQLAKREKLPMLVGDQLPDFELPMLAGDTVLLQKMLGKRLTLLDLWASWCAPCRRENREFLVPIWEKYHAEGFQIVGYALDSNREIWRKAIEKDGAARWLHGSHLGGDEAPLLDALRLRTIPANFLLDDEGRVLAKNLHGEELRTFVANFFK